MSGKDDKKRVGIVSLLPLPDLPGWGLLVSSRDVKRWEPEPCYALAVEAARWVNYTIHAPANTIKISNHWATPSGGKVPIMACVILYGAGATNPARLRGIVWLGTPTEAKKFHGQMRNQVKKEFGNRVSVKSFKYLPALPELN